MKAFRVEVMPGVCHFSCTVRSASEDGKTARIDITGSACARIQELAANLTVLAVRDMFTPLTSNRVFLGAGLAGCHPSCPVPLAVIKAAEAALGLALPADVHLVFSGEPSS